MDPVEAVRADRIVMSWDVPSDAPSGATVQAPVQISGWAYSRAGIDTVVVLVDGTPVRADYGQPRPDVVEALREPDAFRCGFSAVLDDEVCAPASHEMSVVVMDRHQHAVGLTRTVVVQPSSGEDSAGSESAPPPSVAGLGNGGERYVPEADEGAMIAAEHQSRYAWVAALAGECDVLDAGCGVGWGSVVLATAGARRVVGLDIDELAIANARERAAANAREGAAAPTAFVRGDLRALPFDDASFDLVVCFEALEHVTDPDHVLDELRRVLRPEGLLTVSSPNRGVYPSGNPFHLHELTSQELAAALRRRFQNVAIYRQQSHVGSLLTDDLGHSTDDPNMPIDARVMKLSPGKPGDEFYAVGLAGDGELPTPRGVAALSRAIDAEEFHQHAALAEQLLASELARRAAEESLERAERARDRADAARAAAERGLDEQRRTLSWQITAPLRAAKRATLGLRARRRT
jgi:2-polyprenyl-3-methyl-5-hydroxy-6-metoxy-1,4-benzoquinol methylase